jgi:hypothetical protein
MPDGNEATLKRAPGIRHSEKWSDTAADSMQLQILRKEQAAFSSSSSSSSSSFHHFSYWKPFLAHLKLPGRVCVRYYQ